MSEKSKLYQEAKNDIKKPKLYAVVIHNDDYTPMDFVVEVIVKVFHKTTVAATQIMMEVHENGKSSLGAYTFDIAMTKKAQADHMVRLSEYPLQLTIQECEF